MMGKHHEWTPEQLEILARDYPTIPGWKLAEMMGVTVRAVYSKARSMGVKKLPQAIAEMSRAAMTRKDHPAKRTTFQPGAKPWNKGMQWDSGGRSHETRFKPGRPPSEAFNYVPIGSVRKTREGYLEQKVTDTHRFPARRWVAVHRLVWERAHGSIPDKHIVVFKPGMSTAVLEDITINRLECISRAENMRRNSYHTRHPELVKLVQLKGAISRQVNRIHKEHQENGNAGTV